MTVLRVCRSPSLSLATVRQRWKQQPAELSSTTSSSQPVAARKESEGQSTRLRTDSTSWRWKLQKISDDILVLMDKSIIPSTSTGSRRGVHFEMKGHHRPTICGLKRQTSRRSVVSDNRERRRTQSQPKTERRTLWFGSEQR